MGLQSNLFDIQSSPPRSKQEAASRWASLYHEYAQLRTAGALKPTALNKGLIMSIPVGNSNFFQVFSKSIELYWSTAVWLAPGFTGVTSSSAGLSQMLQTSSKKLILMSDANSASQELANTIELHMKTISVAVTNIATGAIVVTTLT